MIEGSGEQAVISTRGAREGLTEKVHLSTDIKEMSKSDMHAAVWGKGVPGPGIASAVQRP